MLALIFFHLANHIEQYSTVTAALYCCKCYVHLNHTNISTEQIQGRFCNSTSITNYMEMVEHFWISTMLYADDNIKTLHYASMKTTVSLKQQLRHV